MKCRFLLSLSVIINLWAITSTSFLHYILSVVPTSKENISFSVFVKEFSGIVLYAVHKEDRFLIKFEEAANKMFVLSQWNNHLIQTDIEILCGCKNCLLKQLTFGVDYREYSISMRCNNQIVSSRSWKTPDSVHQDTLLSYPAPFNYNQAENKVFIWMGNIGLYTGLKNVQYYPYKNQLIGCLEYFYHHGEMTKFKYDETDFLPSCQKTFRQIIHFKNETRTQTEIRMNIFNCSSIVVDDNFCKTEKLLSFGLNQSYTPNNVSNGRVQLILRWKQLFTKNQCLVEFIFKSKSSITIWLNDANFVMMRMQHKQSNYTIRALEKISPFTINILIIEIGKSDFVLKIVSVDEINVYEYEINAELSLVNMGFSHMTSLCGKFQGVTNFQYDPQNLIKLLTVDNTSPNLSTKPNGTNPFLKKFVIIVVAICNIITGLVAVFYWLVKREIRLKKHLPKIPSRNYQLEFNDCINISPPIPESDVYSYIDNY